jgi:hypothetical protein
MSEVAIDSFERRRAIVVTSSAQYTEGPQEHTPESVPTTRGTCSYL